MCLTQISIVKLPLSLILLPFVAALSAHSATKSQSDVLYGNVRSSASKAEIPHVSYRDIKNIFPFLAADKLKAIAAAKYSNRKY